MGIFFIHDMILFMCPTGSQNMGKLPKSSEIMAIGVLRAELLTKQMVSGGHFEF